MHFDSAMAGGYVAGSDSAFAGRACEASFTLFLTTPSPIRYLYLSHSPITTSYVPKIVMMSAIM